MLLTESRMTQKHLHYQRPTSACDSSRQQNPLNSSQCLTGSPTGGESPQISSLLLTSRKGFVNHVSFRNFLRLVSCLFSEHGKAFASWASASFPIICKFKFRGHCYTPLASCSPHQNVPPWIILKVGMAKMTPVGTTRKPCGRVPGPLKEDVLFTTNDNSNLQRMLVLFRLIAVGTWLILTLLCFPL